MASIPSLKGWCFLLAIFCLATSFGKSDPGAVDIVAKALACFSDQSVYSSCQESYRLTAEGKIDVPPAATDTYCDGPCLVETKLALQCVDDILYNFKFYNGATIQDIKYTLHTGCGHTSKRGDFNVLDHLNGGHGEYGDYYGHEVGHGDKLTMPIYVLLLLSCVLLLVGY